MNKQQQRNIFAFNLAEKTNEKQVAENKGRSSWEANKQALAPMCTDTIWVGIPSYSDGNLFC